MKTVILEAQEVLQSYDVVSQIYPYIPSLSHWRSWEHAAYQRYALEGRILDMGCGDGQYFRLLWPEATAVVGVDMNPAVVDLARRSGVYQQVHLSLAHQIPEPDSSFDYVFANCSLEHMDALDQVLKEIYRCLRPGGKLLCSVVTQRFIEWTTLPHLISLAGYEQLAKEQYDSFLDYHHLSNPLPVEGWQTRFLEANLILEEHIPILPLCNSGFFLFLDNLWHVKRSQGGEIGNNIFAILSSNPNFPNAFRHIFEGLIDMETDWKDCSGAVFLASKEL